MSSVYRAKGNEAASVYICGIDSVYQDGDSIRERNKIFTAITRANGWVSLTGMGEPARSCERELAQALKNYPRLEFTMPNRKSLKVFQRDLASEQSALLKIERELAQVATKLGISKEILIERLSKKTKKIK
jgi:superfamily I DNA and RNA helicase